jgi:hypothetical protein
MNGGSCHVLMSAFGTKRTWTCALPMSAKYGTGHNKNYDFDDGTDWVWAEVRSHIRYLG